MDALFKNYSLEKLNDEIDKMISGNSNKVNHLKMFAASDGKKLSVTLLPAKDFAYRYHGLHPSFDADKLINFLDKGINSSCEFWKQIGDLQENHHYMDLIDVKNCIKLNGKTFNLDKIKTSLLGRAVLQMASKFGFRLKIENNFVCELRKILISAWRNVCDYYAQLVKEECDDDIFKTPYWEINATELYVDLLGIWPIEAIEEIIKHCEVYSDEDKVFVIRKKCPNQDNPVLLKLLTFCSEYKEHFKLLASEVYYSGIMPKVIRIEANDDVIWSSDIKYLILHVVRTTFATVDFMDNPNIINHPFFHICKQGYRYKQMVYFDLHEDKVQNDYLYAQTKDNNESSSEDKPKSYEQKEIEKINSYLQNSYASHTVAVSANIETKDGYLLLGKRSKMAIDAGEYYCSVNGQTEFLDENVSFYRISVYEDLPTMNYESNFRVDLNKEIKRESIAELGLTLFEDNWKYYGISYISINNYTTGNGRSITFKAAESIKARRMHFNVLMRNTTPVDFEYVLNSQRYATEKFENSIIKGLKISIYNGNIDRLKKKTLKAFNWVYLNNTQLFIVLLLLVSILNRDFSSNFDVYSFQGTKSLMDIALLGIFLLIMFVNWIKSGDIREKKIHVALALSKYTDGGKHASPNMVRIFEKIEPRIIQCKCTKKEDLHAIFRVMFILYFFEKAKKC